MKTKIYLMIAILCTMISCAEEGPYRMGKLETSIELQYATPTVAEIKVAFPRSNDNLFNGKYCSAYLTLKPLSDVGNDWRKDYISGDRVSDNDGRFVFCFKKLNPDTKYYLILDSYEDFNDSKKSADERYKYYPDFSFTTAKEGDYSGIGNVKCEVVDALFEYTKIKIILPEDLFFEDWYDRHYYLEASTSQNMENSIKASYVEINNSSRNIAEFTFFDLQPGTYYLRLHAAFRYKDNYIGDSDNPININVDTPLIISENEAHQSLQLGFAGVNFTILRITFPSGLFDDNYYYNSTLKVSCKSDSYNSEECNVVGYGSICDVYLPSSFSKGEKINFQMSFSAEIFGRYRDIITLTTTYTVGEQKPLVSNPSMELLFNGADYSVVKVNYPSDIRMYKECYYFMSDNDFSDGEYGILVNHNSDYYLVVKSPMSPNIERYLRVFGSFGILNLGTSDVYLNIEGSIRYPDEAKKLFEVSSEKNNDNLNIIIAPATGFDYHEYSTTTLKCTSYQSSEELLFSANYNYNLSSKNKLVFSLTPSMLEKLNKGKKYTLSISGFSLVMDQQYLNSKTDIYELEWTYQ